MKAYSKQEPKFTRAQLIFVVDVMITSAVESIDSFPLMSTNKFKEMVNGVKEKLGFDLSILYAKITEDGLGCCDVMEMTDMESVLADFIDEDKKVNTTKIATKFVDELFNDYLSNGVSSLDYNLIPEKIP